MHRDITIVGIGEVLWDCLPTVKSLGGAPANCAFHASQYGCRGIVASAVGNDDLGRSLISVLKDIGVEHEIAMTEKPTGRVDVAIGPNGIPEYDIKKGSAWDVIPYTEPLKELARKCNAVCFGTLAQRSKTSRETIYAFLDEAENASYRIFDVNLRQDFYSENILTASLARCNVMKINDSEHFTICKVYGIDSNDIKESCIAMLRRFNLDIVILTCGTDGSWVFAGNESSFLPTPAVKVIDTIGAGDAFTSVFISSLLCGKRLTEAHSEAVKISAFVCTQLGATPKWEKSFL